MILLLICLLGLIGMVLGVMLFNPPCLLIILTIVYLLLSPVVQNTKRYNKLLLSQDFNNTELNPYNLSPCETYNEFKTSQDSFYEGLIVRMNTKYEDKIDDIYKECN